MAALTENFHIGGAGGDLGASGDAFVGGGAKYLAIDIETYSSVDLAKCGVYKYAESPDFKIQLFGYCFLDSDMRPIGEVQVIDTEHGEEIPVLSYLQDSSIIKIAHNAMFERVCLSEYLRRRGELVGAEGGAYLNAEQWQCTMIMANYAGLPSSLKDIGAVLGLEEQKLSNDLVRYFQRHEATGEKWEEYKKYNKRDVEVEIEIARILPNITVWNEYALDQRINDRGIRVDLAFVENAIKFNEKSRTKLLSLMKEITHLENPNSPKQLKEWLKTKGIETESLDKDAVKSLIERTEDEEVKLVLNARRNTSKSSVSKYIAMQNVASKDSRIRGCFRFYGSRTGRFAGRLVQLQNLPQNKIEDLDAARRLVLSGDYEKFEEVYGAGGGAESGAGILSQLIRTALVPAPSALVPSISLPSVPAPSASAPTSALFIVCDYSAIEARVLSWLAGEEWRNEVFRNNGDIYSASAEKMFHVKVGKHGPNAELRQKGKQAELACGYGGSVGALVHMGALKMGMKEEELRPLVDNWRSANKNIVELWWNVDEAVKTAIIEGEWTGVSGVLFHLSDNRLLVTLPSGRNLCYAYPECGGECGGGGEGGGEAVCWGTEDYVRQMNWGHSEEWHGVYGYHDGVITYLDGTGRTDSYGPKFVENIVQAISRDILMGAMLRLEEEGFKIVAHVHDEVVIEWSGTNTEGADNTEGQGAEAALTRVKEIMCKTPGWAEGLVLNAEGYVTPYYKKD